MPIPNLLVELYFTNGQVDRFEVNDAEHARLLAEHLAPSKVFSAAPLTLAEPNSLTSYRTQTIFRVDVSGSDAPHWPYLSNAASVSEISADEFSRLFASEELTRARREAWQIPGTDQEGFIELLLSTGARIIWRMKIVADEMAPMDVVSIERHLLTAGALHGQRLDGATMMINVAHIIRLSFYPGPPPGNARIPVATRQ